MPGNQPFSVGWLVLVLMSSGLCIAASLAPFAFLMRPLRNRAVSRLSPVARWLLVLPAAFFASWLGEIVPRLIFSVGEILLNRQVLFRPGFDSLVWQFWSPFLFVMGGVLMAPQYRLATAAVLGSFKAVVAVVNIVTVVGYVRGAASGPRSTPFSGHLCGGIPSVTRRVLRFSPRSSSCYGSERGSPISLIRRRHLKSARNRAFYDGPAVK